MWLYNRYGICIRSRSGADSARDPRPLRDGTRSVGELVERTGLSQPGVSKHLRVLRESGLVRVRRDAQRRLYDLDPAPLAELDAWLAPYRALWNDRLDALGRHLDEEESS
jgi:DNA-binding transcriptional ArsR family regulator